MRPEDPSDASICKANGWVVGDTLEGTDDYGTDRVIITAIGEAKILAKLLAYKLVRGEWKEATTNQGRERTQSLQYRKWVKI